MAMATTSAPSPGRVLTAWSCTAIAVPARTGDTEAARVAGRVASHQTRARLGGGFRLTVPTSPIVASGAAREGREIRLPLLDVGLAALSSFLGHVVEQRRVARQLLDAGQAVVRRVHPGLDHAQRQRAVLQHPPGPGHRLLLQPFQRHHLVDQAHLQRLLSVVLIAEEPDLASLLLPHDAGQQPGPVDAVEDAHSRPRLPEARVVGGYGQVADDVEDVAAADGVAGDHCYHGLGGTPDLDLEVEDVEAADALGVAISVVAPDALVTARAEGFGAGAGEDDDADLWIVTPLVEGVAQFENRRGPEGVSHLGAVDGDLGDPVHGVVPDVLVVASSLPTVQVITPRAFTSMVPW